MERTTMKTVDEMADELCRIAHGPEVCRRDDAHVREYQRLAKHVLDLIAQGKAPNPGDEMTDEEVAKELYAAYQEGGAGEHWDSLKSSWREGLLHEARRARELFRPGSKAPEEKGEEPYFVRQLRSDLDNTIAVARKLARYTKYLMAAIRLGEDWNKIEELADEWADVDDPDDPEDRDGV